jgi:hypothetical protein
MVMRTPVLAAIVFAAATVLFPASSALALTADQVIELTRGGVSEAVILAVIARDNVPFDLDTTQLVTLKQAGVSDTIVMAMLKSGRGEAPDAPITVIAPDVLIIGHGPDIPNTSYWDRLYWNPSYVIPFIPAYAPPVVARPLVRPHRVAR